MTMIPQLVMEIFPVVLILVVAGVIKSRVRYTPSSCSECNDQELE